MKKPYIGNLVLHHRKALKPHAERESLHLFRIVARGLEYIGMHHACARKLEPSGFFAHRASFLTAYDAGDIHLETRFGEGKKARAQTDFHISAEQPRKEHLDDRFEIRDGNVFVRHEPFKLPELDVVRSIGCLIAVYAPGYDDAERWVMRFHIADLYRRGVGTEQ